MEGSDVEWIDPVWAVPTIILGAVGVLVARWRKAPLIEIAMGTGGYFLFIWGLMWASSFDRGAFLAAGAASLGSLLFTMGDACRDRRRAASEPQAT
ncbi:MAG: hypothetical protein ABI534_03535 [Chloroflexota bacterium]